MTVDSSQHMFMVCHHHRMAGTGMAQVPHAGVSITAVGLILHHIYIKTFAL